MQPFTRQVIEIISSIPAGRVMTYGDIALSAGNRRGARQVVRILHTMTVKHNLPWHRVINAQGMIAIQGEEARWTQIHLLRGEGVEVDDQGRLDLVNYRWIP